MRAGPAAEGGVEGQLEVGGVLGDGVTLHAGAGRHRPFQAGRRHRVEVPDGEVHREAERQGLVDAGVGSDDAGAGQVGGRRCPGSTGSPPATTTTVSLALGAAISRFPPPALPGSGSWVDGVPSAGGPPSQPGYPSSPWCARQGSRSVEGQEPGPEPLHGREPQRPVDPEHRLVGGGVPGLDRSTAGRMKAASRMRLAAFIRPDVDTVETWNAAANQPMLRINPALGFAPVQRFRAWFLSFDSPATLTSAPRGARGSRAERVARRPTARHRPRNLIRVMPAEGIG